MPKKKVYKRVPRSKKKPPVPRVTKTQAQDAALLLVEHRDAQGGGGKRQSGASEAARLLGQRRAALQTPEERAAVASQGGKAFWSSMTAKERSIEQRRRYAVRVKNLKKRRLAEARGEEVE